MLDKQIMTKSYNLLYLSPLEAKTLLETKLSRYGRVIIPVIPEEKSENKEEIVVIPQENPEEKQEVEIKSSQSSSSLGLGPVIYVTELKKNFPQIDKIIEDFNSEQWASKMVTRTFYLKEGSLERIALAIANVLGVPPEKIEGINLKKVSWMEMQLTSPSIDLGNIGAVGKKP